MLPNGSHFVLFQKDKNTMKKNRICMFFLIPQYLFQNDLSANDVYSK